MSPRTPESPWLGGAGARWAQVLLFALHLALLGSLVLLLITFREVRSHLPIEPWQEGLLLLVIGLSFVVFARRTWRIGANLWRAATGRELPPQDDDTDDEDGSES